MRGAKERKAPAASPLFIWSFLFAGEQKIDIGSFLIMRQSLPDTNFWLVKVFWKPFNNENTLKRDREAKFEQILKEILLELEDKGGKITLKD